MFETATLSYGPNAKRVWTTAVGFTGQALLIGAALLAPMISPQMLPRATWITTLAAPGPPPPPPPPPGGQVVPRTTRAVSQLNELGLIQPRFIPAKAQILIDTEPPVVNYGAGVPGGMEGGREGGRPGGIPWSIAQEVGRFIPTIKPPEVIREIPPAPPAPKAAPPRITQLRMATPIHRVDPVYPPLAKQARVSGTVELLGVLGTDGRIHEIKVIHGHPLLVNAAVEAVRQWVYEPTMLNGQAVEVSAPILVNFILNQ